MSQLPITAERNPQTGSQALPEPESSPFAQGQPLAHLWILVLATIFLLSVLLFAVFSSPIAHLGRPITVDFSAVPAPETAPSAASGTIRVGIAELFMVAGAETFFQTFFREFERQYPSVSSHTLTLGISSEQLFERLNRHEIDVALIGAGAVALLPASHGYEFLATLVTNGTTTFSTCLIVPASSSVCSPADLHNQSFIYTDRFSYSGYAFPRQQIQSLGLLPETFFRHTIFSTSHEKTLYLMKRGAADGAVIDRPVYEMVLKTRPEFRSLFRIISEWFGMPMPAVIVSSSLSEAYRTSLRRYLLSLHDTADGRSLLAQTFIERFVPPETHLYERLRPCMDKYGPLKGTP